MQRDEWLKQWQQSLLQVRRELSSLCADERQWLEQHLGLVVELKSRLHDLFVTAGGPGLCHKCDGACCAHGQHHMTLVEVLAAAVSASPLPEPCADATCPFLSQRGCLLEPGMRPFNCVTFQCEQVEERLSAQQREEFYRLENELRELYQLFERRYAGASLRGLVIRSQRLGDARLLGPP